MEKKLTIKDEMFSRFHDLISEKDRQEKIVIFGCGAIGSYAALAVAKMGFENITLLDHDFVEAVNVGTQLFGSNKIALPKIEATRDAIAELTASWCKMSEQKFDYDLAKDFVQLGEMCRDAIVISAIDSMKARDWLFKLCPMMGVKHFIDGRMAIEFLDVYSVNINHPDSYNKYLGTLFSDDQGVPEPCTNKSIGYTAMIAGGVIGKMVKDVATKKNEAYQNFKFNIAELGGECM